MAWTIREAERRDIPNYAVLGRHKTIPPAMAALPRDPSIRIDGFLCPGHVSVVIGAQVYEFLARECRAPCVIGGFEPADMDRIVRSMADTLREVGARVVAGDAKVLETLAQVPLISASPPAPCRQ